MTRHLVRLGVALALLAGCGGGDDEGGGSSEPTKQEFVAEANRICREGEEQLDRSTAELQAEIRQADSPEARQRVVADALEDTAQEYEPFLHRLHDLEPPESLAGDWGRFMDGIGEAFDLIPELADAYRDADRAKLSELTDRFAAIAGDTRPFAEKNGLKDCLPDTGQAP
jgi:hypothetical protein